jgi:hypothetical protein
VRYESGKLAIYIGEPDAYLPFIHQFDLVEIDRAFGFPYDDCDVRFNENENQSWYISKSDLRLIGVL